MAKTSIPAVPLRSPFFEVGPDGVSRISRVWVIFFERLGRSDAEIQKDAEDHEPAEPPEPGISLPAIGFDLQDTTPGLDVSDPVIPPAQLLLETVQIRVKVADSTNDLEIDIRNNGTSIFSTRPVIAAGSTSRTVHHFTSFAGPQTINPEDDVVIDVIQGGEWQVAVYMVGPSPAAGGGGGGSTSSPLTTKGDIWVFDTADDRLPVGTDGQVLTADSTQASGLKWAAGGGGGGGTGTVTSVALAMPAEFAVSGSPVTASGTFTVTKVTEPAGQVYAGPTSGAAAAPVFRALVATDIPNIAESQVTNLVTDLASKATLPIAQSSVTNLVTDLAAKAPLASPALTGTPTAPTAAAGTNTTQIATTAFVEGEFGPGGAGAYFAWGGDGSDSSVTFDGSSTVLGMVPSASVYTMTRDICCVNITVNSGVTIKTVNYAIFATGTVTINGTVHNDGQDASNGGNASSATGGTGGNAGLRTSSPSGSDGHYVRLITVAGGTAGGNGGTAAGTQAAAANAGASVSSSTPVDGSGVAGSTGASGGKGGTGTSGAGGASRAGGAAGGIFTSTNAQTGRTAAVAAAGASFNATGTTATPHPVWASNACNEGARRGSGGGGDTTNSGGGGGGGGGEGGSGGVVGIFANTITIGVTGIVRANGGKGGNGGNGRTQTVGNVGGGGGGGGGSGGVGGIVWLVYHQLTNSGTVQANGGTAGTGGLKGSPSGTGTDNADPGANGSTGPAGNVVLIRC